MITFGLIYLPVDYQIHSIEWLAGAYGHPGCYRDFRCSGAVGCEIKPPVVRTETLPRCNGSLAAGILVLVIPTNLYLWAWRFVDLSRHSYPYYLYKDELDAMGWLENNARPDDVVFSSLTTGQYVPALTGMHAYLAHWAQTLDFFTKSKNVDDFLQGSLDTERQMQILKDGSVDYVFWGPAEKAAGSEEALNLSVLKPVYTNPLVTIFRVGNIN